MLQNYSWFVYALTAAVLWGMHYATAEQLSKTMPPFLISIIYLVFVAIFSVVVMVFFIRPVIETKTLLSYLSWATVSQLGLLVLSGCISNFLVFSAIADSSATKASIVETTYPFFVALFAMIIYGENQLNAQIIIGGILILTGATVVIKS